VRGLARRSRGDRRSPGRSGGGPRRRRRRVRCGDRSGCWDRAGARGRLPPARARDRPARGAGGARGGPGVTAGGPARGDRPRSGDGRRAAHARLDPRGGRRREHRRSVRDLGAGAARPRPPPRGGGAGPLRRAQAARHRRPDRRGHRAGPRSHVDSPPGVRPPRGSADRRLRLRRSRDLRTAADRPGIDARRAGRGLRRRRCRRCRRRWDRGLGDVVCGRRPVRGGEPGGPRDRPTLNPAASRPGRAAASTSRIAGPPGPPR
jgi:hypothetical protein